MKITMYELLGLVKDDKAPKKVIYDRLIWNFEEDNLYYCYNVWLDDYCNISQVLNDEVEIIEPQEHKIPEKIKMRVDSVGDINNKIENLNLNQMIIEDKINEIIDYLEVEND